MRKILYQELKKRLSRLLMADSGDIELVSEERIKQMTEAGETPDFAIKHFGLWNRQVEFIYTLSRPRGNTGRYGGLSNTFV
mgnify:CR=1 FL=1